MSSTALDMQSLTDSLSSITLDSPTITSSGEFITRKPTAAVLVPSSCEPHHPQTESYTRQDIGGVDAISDSLFRCYDTVNSTLTDVLHDKDHVSHYTPYSLALPITNITLGLDSTILS